MARVPGFAPVTDAPGGTATQEATRERQAKDDAALSPPLTAAIVDVVVVGQVPPPVNGQSLMISEFLAGTYPGLHIEHVPMEFSRSTAEIGSFGLRKVGLLFKTLAGIFRAWHRSRRSGRPAILYYPPAGANLIPVLRDFVLLIPTRWLFRRTVFHFHAAGLYGIYARLPAVLRPLFHLAYDRPDLAIFTTRLTSAEGALLKARKSAIIACGIADDAAGFAAPQVRGAPVILYAGILCEGKGVLTLLEACRMLHTEGVPFQLICLGAFQSSHFEQQVRSLIHDGGIEEVVSFPGVITGDEKKSAFASADIFCFPSHYPAESFGVVLIEAMSFSLPIVATDWQGIPEVTGRSGGACLVPIKEPRAVADSLRRLLDSADLRQKMGSLNRERYLQYFTVATYRESLHLSLLGLSASY